MRLLLSHRLDLFPAARSRALAVLLAGAVAGTLGAATLGFVRPAPEHKAALMVEVASAKELTDLFASRDYLGDLPAAKAVAVPRILLASVPADLDAVATPAERKDLFLRLMLPLVLTANEEIAADRAQLLAIADLAAAGADMSGEQAAWLEAIARRYGVADSGDLDARLAELLRRVDTVPPSLAIAQAALESGWGTSRLAREGNALFGERTWTQAGLDPLVPEPGAKHRARSFGALLDAVEAYMGNLNTHAAYAEFRRVRAGLRASGDVPEGVVLVDHLKRYSELGSAYTQAVRGLIRANRLQALDLAALQQDAAGDI